jgi:hypothetical protein
MSAIQRNALKKLENEGCAIKVIDENFQKELLVYAYYDRENVFKEYAISRHGSADLLNLYKYSPQLFDFFQSA